MYNSFKKMLTFYDNIIFTQRQVSAMMAEMSDLSLLWKLIINTLEDQRQFGKVSNKAK